MSVSKDFPGLENLEKLFQDFQGPARALISVQSCCTQISVQFQLISVTVCHCL